MTELMRQIIEGKKRERSRLAALPFEEKVAILEKLRERSLLLAQSPLRKKSAAKES